MIGAWLVIIGLLWCWGWGMAHPILPRQNTKAGFPQAKQAPLSGDEYDDAIFGLAALRASKRATSSLSAGSQINCNAEGIVPVVGSGGDVTLTSNPQVLAPTSLPTSKLCIVVGTNDGQSVTLVNGNGLLLPSASVTLGNGDMLWLLYDGAQWIGFQGGSAGASTLDQAFDNNRRIDGAVSLGSAVQLGGTTRAWHLYQDGTGALRVRACDTAGANCVTPSVRAETGSNWEWVNENGTTCYTINSVTGVLTESTAGTCTPNILSGGGSGDITAVGTCTTGSCATEGGNDMFPFIYEGTADAFETTFQVTDPTADRNITFPDASGEVSLLGQSISGAEVDSALDLGGNASLEIPNSAAPTTDAFGEIAGDNNAWATGRGAVQWYDGTANTYLVGALASDTPANGQVPKWNTGGTITWEDGSLIMYHWACDDQATDQSSFMALTSNCAASETSNSTAMRVAGVAGTLTNLTCASRAAPGSGTTWTFTLRLNFTTNTSLTCNYTNPNTSCTSAATQAIVATDVITIDFSESGTVFDGSDVYCTVLGRVP